MKITQQVLGHADIGTNSDFYSDQDGRIIADTIADSLKLKVSN